MTIQSWLEQQSLWLKAKHYYQRCNSREQRYIQAGVLLLSLLIVFRVVLLPAYDYMAVAVNAYQRSLDNLSWMKASQHLVKVASATEQSLLGTANETSQALQFQFKRFEPAGDSGLTIWVESIEFNVLVRWLIRMKTDYGVSIADISVERLDQQPGIINARVVLEG